MVLRVVIMDTGWKAYVRVLKWEEFFKKGGSKSSRKAVGGNEVLAEDSEGMGERGAAEDIIMHTLRTHDS